MGKRSMSNWNSNDCHNNGTRLWSKFRIGNLCMIPVSLYTSNRLCESRLHSTKVRWPSHATAGIVWCETARYLVWFNTYSNQFRGILHPSGLFPQQHESDQDFGLGLDVCQKKKLISMSIFFSGGHLLIMQQQISK